MTAISRQAALPDGVVHAPLRPHADDRGVFTEVFRQNWAAGPAPVQWNVVRSNANVLRGVHGHWRHWDYLSCVAGRMLIGLKDLRRGSPSYGLAGLVELDAAAPSSLQIPAGVAHGFYFPEPSVHAYAVSHYWDMADELGCRWDDPALGITWPFDAPKISPRDEALGDMATLEAQLNRRMKEAAG